MKRVRRRRCLQGLGGEWAPTVDAPSVEQIKQAMMRRDVESFYGVDMDELNTCSKHMCYPSMRDYKRHERWIIHNHPAPHYYPAMSVGDACAGRYAGAVRMDVFVCPAPRQCYVGVFIDPNAHWGECVEGADAESPRRPNAVVPIEHYRPFQRGKDEFKRWLARHAPDAVVKGKVAARDLLEVDGVPVRRRRKCRR